MPELVATLTSHVKTSTLPSGRTYEYIDVPPEGPYKAILLLLHGFPDSWFGWRHQILPWAQRGYRVLAPSALGYGNTDRPKNPADYTFKKLSDDLLALLDVAGVPSEEKILIVSHDWGALTGWRFLQWHGEKKVRAFCSVSIPFVAPPEAGTPYVPIEEIAKRVPALSYQVYFNEPNAHKELEANRERFLDLIYQTPDQLAASGLGKPGGFKAAVNGSDPVPACPFWEEEERKFYNLYFEKSGFEAALGFYRSYRPKYDEETSTPPPLLPAAIPKLVIHPTADSTALPALMDKTAALPGVELRKIDGAGHWVLQTHPEQIAQEVGDWLDSVLAGKENARL